MKKKSLVTEKEMKNEMKRIWKDLCVWEPEERYKYYLSERGQKKKCLKNKNKNRNTIEK